jgi:mono/diheme cytochrome c family protein
MAAGVARGPGSRTDTTDQGVAPSFSGLDMMRLTLLSSLLVLLAAGSASAQSEKGKQVYSAQKCSVCHSIAGVGNKKGELDKVGATLSEADIRSWITNAPEMAAKAKAERKPAMKAYTLPQDELDALVAYLQTLK